MREGTTVSLPVFHTGALFYFGDGHAAQGDGEVCGSGLETSMEVAFRFDLVKKKAIAWPRLEDAENLMQASNQCSTESGFFSPVSLMATPSRGRSRDGAGGKGRA